MKLSGGRKWGVFGERFFRHLAVQTMIAALAVALELAVSGTSPPDLAVPAMAHIHAIIGIGEGLDYRWRPGADLCRST